MSNIYESPRFQAHGLPPRPLQSYKSPNRRRPQRKSSKFNNQENWQLSFKPPRFRQSHRPLTDASNSMTTLPYNVSPPLAYPLSTKPTPFFFCPVAPHPLFPPASWTPAALQAQRESDHMGPLNIPIAQTLRTSPIPPRSHGLTALSVGFEPKVIVSSKTRRKLAVEGVRKAASDAALRKMGMHGGISSDYALDQPIALIVEKPSLIDSKSEIQSESEPIPPIAAQDVQPQPYSPRQYTPRPLLLPSILALGHPARSPPPATQSLFSPRRNVTSFRLSSSSRTCCHVETQTPSLAKTCGSSRHVVSDTQSEAEDLEKFSERCSTPTDRVSTTPCDSSFASDDEDHPDPMILAGLDDADGSTTPCDSSFSISQVIELEINGTGTPDAKAEANNFEIPLVDDIIQPSPDILTALMWTIAAPRTRTECRPRSNVHPSNHYHRKSLGFFLGAAMPHETSTQHNRATSESCLTLQQFSPSDYLSDASSVATNEIRAYGGSVNQQDLLDKPVAQPTFILPTDTRSEVCTNLRNIGVSKSMWAGLFRKPSLSFLNRT